VRIWIHSPAFTLFVVGGLALAIGLNTAVFTIVNAALFRNLPFRNSNRIAYLASFDRAHGDEPLQVFSYADYKDFEARLRSFEDLAAVQYTALNLSDGANFPERCRAVRMTANTLSVIGQRPLEGRDLTPADTQPGAPLVVLMTYRLWARRYSKDSSVIGKTVRIDENPAMVIGVTAPGVRFAGDNDLFLPLVKPQSEARGQRDLGVMGRLAPGVGLGQASAEAAAVAQQLGTEYPATDKDLGAVVQNVSEYQIPPRIRQVLKAMLGGVGFVLLIACANAANLLLGRAMMRSREISIRASLGAGRADIIRQLLTESVLLSTAAGVLGSVFAYAGVKAFGWALGQMAEFGKPDWVVFSVDRNVLLYSLAISIGTGIVFGLAPALRMSRGELSSALRESGHGATGGVRRRWISAVLVAGEVALSVVLLLGAGLMVRSMANSVKAGLGVNTANVLTVRVSLPGAKYRKPEQKVAFFRDLRTRLEALPGVETVAWAGELPGNGGIREDVSTFQIDDEPIGDEDQRPQAAVLVVGPGYFRTMQAVLLRGREFTDLDGDVGREAAIVNQSFAAKQWPGSNPVGKRVLVDDHGRAAWSTVVGVAADIMQTDYSRGLPRIYLPYRQDPDESMYIAARTSQSPANLATAFRQSVRELDEDLPVFALRTLAEHVSMSRGDTRLFTSAFALLAGIALVLASMGLYAVILQSVSQRTREFGIRVAMGATRRQLLWLVCSQGMRQFTIGLAIGLILSLGVGRVLSAQLVGVSSIDPVTYLLVVAVLTIAAALACGLPARRATRSDPAEVLHLE
jgi:putative ABC transport system permease protein